uniref:RING-type domain-containing protein n=1 Tax=Mola mola TaxID=94237 RepID=A0A3Q3XQC2_MOLML
MASSTNMLPDKQFQCTICQQAFTDPVTTPCGHNFCQACIQNVWDSSEVCQCPACNKSFHTRPEISINIAFKELADTFRKIIACSSHLAAGSESKPLACRNCLICDRSSTTLLLILYKMCLL